MQIAHDYVITNGVRLHLVSAGPEDGPLLILLHGFPEYWGGWINQIEPLAAAGFRVWVPDQRGYNLSEKPTAVADYNLDQLAADVVGLIDAAGVAHAFLVGHDWGGVVAWWTANKHPERIERLAVLNCPHHAVMQKALQGSRRQLARSWYMFFFQIPGLPEWGMARFNWVTMARQMQQSSRPGTFATAELDALREVWSRPGGMASMINWYRALFRTRPERLASPRIVMPTLLIWGKKDKFLGHEMAQKSVELCDLGRVELIDDATHWVQHEEPERVNQLLIDFFSGELA